MLNWPGWCSVLAFFSSISFHHVWLRWLWQVGFPLPLSSFEWLWQVKRPWVDIVGPHIYVRVSPVLWNLFPILRCFVFVFKGWFFSYCSLRWGQRWWSMEGLVFSSLVNSLIWSCLELNVKPHRQECFHICSSLLMCKLEHIWLRLLSFCSVQICWIRGFEEVI